jgi:hypothetical protein
VRIARDAVELRRGHHRQDGWVSPGLVEVDPGDAGMGQRAAHERRLGDTGKDDVGDELRATREQRPVLAPAEPGADVAVHGFRCHHETGALPGGRSPVRPQASSTACTICW